MTEPNITRMDYERTHGYWVRIYRTEYDGTKRCYSKYFSDGTNGGKRKALVAARKWRDAQSKKLRPRERGGGTVPVGHGYVRRTEVLRRAEYSHVFVAWLRIEDGRCKSTSRSITVWGKTGAKRECEKWLKEQRKELRGRVRQRPNDED